MNERWKQLGPESARGWLTREANGFFKRYMSGEGLDVGYRGSKKNALPVLESAIGVDLDYPGYDGVILPFDDKSLDYVYTSHILEHVPTKDVLTVIQEWYRVLKIGGHLIIMVPHWHLYERKAKLPSIWNRDHKRFYTPSVLLKEVEMALPVNRYRVRHLIENDDKYQYGIPAKKHAQGAYEIELVVEKLPEHVTEFIDG